MNKTQITLPSWLCSKEISKLFSWLEQYGEVRFVGGCVRDALLNKKSKDIDIATTVEPEKLMELAKKDRMLAKPTGITFGTVTVIINKTAFEVTSLRKDMATDGRHAVVSFTTDWSEDAMRRDFTINAMSLDKDGNVYDYTTGLEDIKKPVVKFVGDADTRIKEDYLRILRFFRFSAFYMSGLPKAGLKECAENKQGMEQLSGERIQQEMMKLCSATEAYACLEAMAHVGILDVVMQQAVEEGQVAALKKLVENEEVFKVTPDPLARVAVLANDVQLVIERWKLSNKDAKRLRFFAKAGNFKTEKDAKEYIRLRGNDIAIKSLIVAASKQGRLADAKLMKLAKEWQAPEFPIAGKDLVEEGFEAGSAMGALLRSTEKHWVESDYVLSREELLAFAKK